MTNLACLKVSFTNTRSNQVVRRWEKTVNGLTDIRYIIERKLASQIGINAKAYYKTDISGKNWSAAAHFNATKTVNYS